MIRDSSKRSRQDIDVMEHPSKIHVLTLSLQEHNESLGIGVNSETANMMRDRSCHCSFDRQRLIHKSRRHEKPVR